MSELCRIPHLLPRLLCLALPLVFVLPALADDVGVTSARLVELADGGYALEADVPPVLLPALRPPVLPERFTLAERPQYRRVGLNLVVRYEFGGSDRALEAGDVLLLPWGRSAVLLTARWRDGTVQRAMFPRGSVGISVPIETLKPRAYSAAAIASRHLGVGLRGATSSWLRLLFLIAIVMSAGGWRTLRLALVFAGGHALSMVALELGAPNLPQALAAVGLGLGAVLLARSALRRDGQRLWPLVLAVGFVDGMGLAETLARPNLEPGALVPALFGAFVGMDAALLAATCIFTGLWQWLRPRRLALPLIAAVGGLAVAATLASSVSSLRATNNLGIDPADRMAAARFDFMTAAGGGGSSTRQTPPRRLEKAAMVFLTVEPMEVRVEVLISLQDFLGPLRIQGDRGSVVPVEVQGAIASRARKMVTSTMGTRIDGREAVPLFERTDFVSVAATGVATRQQPEPEPLDNAVLGVTLAYGVERPPSEIELQWQVFPAPDTVVPAVWADPTGSERVELAPGQSVLRWSNDLSSYATPPAQAVPVQPRHWPAASFALAGLAVLVWIGPLRRGRRLAWMPLLVAILLYPFVRTPLRLPGIDGWGLSRQAAAEVVDDLLTDVYRSFDLRDEEAIYDRLAISVTGEQLSEIYLENRRALELENRGGARARVDEVEVLEVRSVRRDGDGGLRVDATWTVSGSVNHFGHVHYRQNRYDASLRLLAVDGAWKIGGLEVTDERRIL